jgi:hypothetical protein
MPASFQACCDSGQRCGAFLTDLSNGRRQVSGAALPSLLLTRGPPSKQFNRHRRELRILRTRLGRLIRDIGRKIAGQESVEAAFALPLARASQIRSQQQRQRGWKLYSFHAPETECIGKGKASAPYEFGVKVSIVTTNAPAPGGQFVLHFPVFGLRQYLFPQPPPTWITSLDKLVFTIGLPFGGKSVFAFQKLTVTGSGGARRVFAETVRRRPPPALTTRTLSTDHSRAWPLSISDFR